MPFHLLIERLIWMPTSVYSFIKSNMFLLHINIDVIMLGGIFTSGFQLKTRDKSISLFNGLLLLLNDRNDKNHPKFVKDQFSYMFNIIWGMLFIFLKS